MIGFMMRTYFLPLIFLIITCHVIIGGSSVVPNQETSLPSGFDDLSGNKIGSILSYLTSEVHKIGKQVNEFTTRTRDSLQQLRRERINLAEGIRTNSDKIAQFEQYLQTGNAVTTPHPIAVAAQALVSGAHKVDAAKGSAPWALLYDEPGDETPVFTFNPNREQNIACLTFKNSIVDEIDTRGSCVLLYTKEGCTGQSRKFETKGREPVGQDFDDNNLSIGPCPSDNDKETEQPPTRDFLAKSQAPPMASLYSQFDSAQPSFNFNHLRQTSPSCFTYDDRNVNAINTFGTCVLMYTGEECTGHRVKIQTSHRMRVPAEMEHNNLSVGPCYALADLHDQLRLEGSPVQIYDSRRHGTCSVVDVQVQSLNTYDTCLKVYSGKDCKGESHMVMPGNHRDIQKLFKPAIKSIGPCYS